MSSVVSELLPPDSMTKARAKLISDEPAFTLDNDDGSELAASRGFARGAIIGLGCWVVLGAAIWAWIL